MSSKPEEDVEEIRVYREALEDEGLVLETGTKFQVNILEKIETPSE